MELVLWAKKEKEKKAIIKVIEYTHTQFLDLQLSSQHKLKNKCFYQTFITAYSQNRQKTIKALSGYIFKNFLSKAIFVKNFKNTCMFFKDKFI